MATSICGLAQCSDNAHWDDRFHLPGVDGTVSAIAVSGNDVYVAGSFVHAGRVLANNIAKWDGTNWSFLGGGVPGGSLRAVAVRGRDVYVGGTFNSAGGVSATKIAKWNLGNADRRMPIRECAI